MAVKSVSVRIKGISHLLMHSFPMIPVEALEKKPIAEQAELAAYRDPDTGGLYVPAMAIQRSLIASATFSKGKGRGSLQKVVAACILVSPERVPLGQDSFTVDARPVVIPATKGRVMRYRPRLDVWEISFTIDYDDTLVTGTQLRRVVDDAGSRVGLLDFRPEKKGPFGRFMVTSWE